MKCFSLLCVWVLSYTICHAQTNATDTAIHINLDTLNVSASPGPPAYQATATKVWEIYNTRIALSFNWRQKTADAKEWIKLHPYCYATDTIVLDAQSMRIDSVQLVSKKGNSRLNYSYEKDVLKIWLGRQYKATDSIELYLRYTAMPYAEVSGGSKAIVDDRGLYFVNTDHKSPFKPSEIWTQGETESNSHWMITIDKPNTRFTTQLELTVPDSCVSLSNGSMIKQVKNTDHTHTDIWRMDMPIQAYAVMFAIGNYSIIKDKWKNKEVSYYVEPEFAPYARQMFNNTVEMMDFFSKRTGIPYPWSKYSQVVARDYVSGAMENTSATLFGEFINATPREIKDHNSEDIVSHELFHQWFGDYVTAESWSNLTVNESFANYGEQLWRAYKYGKASADELAYNDLQIYLARSASHDPDLVRFTYDDKEEMFDGISYNKGGAILRYLNTLIGDEAFDKAMNIYLTKNALHPAEAHNWRMAVEEATGQDWNWFFNQWYYRGGHPVLKVTYDYNDTTQKLKVTVAQTQEDSTYIFNLPLKAAVIYGSNKSVIDWNITHRKETFTYDYRNGEKPVIIPDYTHVLPGDVKDIKKTVQWIVQFTYADDYISKLLAVSAAGRQMSDSVSQALLELAFNDSLPSIRRVAISQLTKASSDKYHKRWTSRLMDMAIRDKNLSVRAEAVDILGNWKATEAKQLFVSAIWDSSYAIAGHALEGLDKLDKDTAYILAKQVLKTAPHGSLEYNAWSVIGRKAEDADIAYLENMSLHVSGNRRILFASSLASYLKKVKSDEAFRRGVTALKNMVLREEMKSFRSAMGGSVFEVAGDLKEKLKNATKEDMAALQARKAIIKAACEQLVAEEHEPDTLKSFKKMMKENFDADTQ